MGHKYKQRTYSSSSKEDCNESSEEKLNINNNSNDSVNSTQSSKVNKSKSKIFQDRSTIFEKMIPSEEELNYRKKKLNNDEIVNLLSKEFKCTKCGFDFEKLINKNQEINFHPLMDVLMCDECCEYYGDDDFSLDSDNEDKYCRWCGEGGTILSCSQCICGFCNICIKKHFGKASLKEIKNEDEWLCYFCNPKPLWKLRLISTLAKKKCESLKKNKEENQENTPSLKSKKNIKKKKKKSGIYDDTTDSEENEKQKKKMKIITEDKNLSESPVVKQVKNKTKQKYNLNNEEEEEINNHDDDTEEKNSSENFELKPTKKKKIKRKLDENKEKEVNNTTDAEISLDNLSPVQKKKLKLDKPSRYDNNPSEEELSFDLKKFEYIEKLENLVKLTEYQMDLGANWSKRKLTKLQEKTLFDTEEKMVKQCKKIKWYISSLASLLIGFSNSVEAIEKSISKKETNEKELEKQCQESPNHDFILKFLNFLANQVKMLKDKSIDLKAVFDAGTYDMNSLVNNKEMASDSVVNYGIIDENIKNTGNVFILHEKSEGKSETNDNTDASLFCDEEEPKLKICSANSTPIKCAAMKKSSLDENENDSIKKSDVTSDSHQNKNELKNPIKMSIDLNNVETEENEKKGTSTTLEEKNANTTTTTKKEKSILIQGMGKSNSPKKLNESDEEQRKKNIKNKSKKKTFDDRESQNEEEEIIEKLKNVKSFDNSESAQESETEKNEKTENGISSEIPGEIDVTEIFNILND